ncbi:hypothetical protein FC826_02985 [Clostridium botulinum]|uniref:Uncharacterized protein n=1 Tax=Clostridium botulinum TaxID=1491 RepID=A0A6B5A0Z3_CLOBO|nr:ABC-three component system middle component 2 [Clostridium sporogenes]NFD75838.1 hypothetical protein [Clostridium botulinum]MCW6091725.1 hypothetical protein [Clostridium sporogenes]MCW6091732.1 hypothetical protein [Clostridium sporogenes]NFD83749.1 hypothetical protein [Clostridium botulinum]NFE07721.1 hypothetical protein [Clostridium botulinum]
MKHNNNQLLNTPVELGMRALVILSLNQEIDFDLERLIYYDYISTHLSDYNEQFKSLHPSSPYRSGEVLAKREIMRKGLLFLIKKDLIYILFNSDGIIYRPNKYSMHFLNEFKSPYLQQLINHASNGSNLLNDKSIEELRNFFSILEDRVTKENTLENIIRGV